jgi:hypothetical protein
MEMIWDINKMNKTLKGYFFIYNNLVNIYK